MKSEQFGLLFGLLLITLGVVAFAAPVSAHHSFSALYLDQAEPIEIRGPIVQFVVRNPHSFIHVMAPDEHGEMQRWIAEWGGARQISDQGVTRESLLAGEEVIMTGLPSRNPDDHRLVLRTLVRPSDGWSYGLEGETFD